MKIVKQKDKLNQYNIENLTLARLLQINLSLEYTKKHGLLTFAGNRLLESLNNQIKSKSYLKPEKVKDYLCQCNNCGTICIDTNPQTTAKKKVITGDEPKLFDNSCPICLTDSYLTDL